MKVLTLALLLGMLFLPACTSEQAVQAPEVPEQIQSTEVDLPETSPETVMPLNKHGDLPPVETRVPNTEYAPAFPGQTRSPGIKTQTVYSVEIMSEELQEPWAVTPVGDRLLITEKGGTMRLFDSDGKLSAPLRGLPKVDSDGQGGLLDVRAAPAFADSRTLYFTFSEKHKNGTLTALGKARLSQDGTALEEVSVIHRALPYHKSKGHFGSRIAFDAQGNIFYSTGDRQGSDTRPMAQSLDNGYGKILHVTPSGEPVEGSPFVQTDAAWPEIYSYGHRNVQGLDTHPVTGELWAAEMGPKGGDELNLIKPGLNYGWPTIGYGVEYSGAKIGEGITEREDMAQPAYYWDPVLAPSGMSFYSGKRIEEWQNDLFIAGLAGKHIARLVLEGDRVVAEERLLEDENQRFRDITEGSDGALYAVTDQGRLYRISR